MPQKNIPTSRPLLKAGALSALAALVASSSSFAATASTWTGASSTDFETPGNWTPGAPANDTTTNYAVFSGTPTVNQPTLTTDRSVAGLQFGSTAGWTLGGLQELKIGSTIPVAGKNASLDASALTSGTNTISVDRLHLNGTYNDNDNYWFVGSGGTLQVDRKVSNGQLNFGDGNPNGTLILGDNVTGGQDNGSLNVMVRSGTVLLNKLSSGGDHAASELKIYGGLVQVTGSNGAQLYQGGLLEVRSGGTFDLNGHSELIGSLASFDGSTGGIIDNTTATPVTLTVTGGNGWTYNGKIQNSGGGALSLVIDNAGNGNAVRLAGNSTFTGGTTIKSGELRISGGDNAGNPLGTGTITIGDAANTGASAMLKYNGGGPTTLANAISIVGTGTNTLTADDWNPTFTGQVTLSSNLTLSSTNPFGSTIIMQGGVIGTGNITISANAANGGSRIEFNTGAVNNTGTITNNGTGIGDTNIYSTIGSNVTNVTQNSATSKLFLNAGNSYGTTTVSAGLLEVSSSGSLGLGDVTVANSATLTLGSFTSINDVAGFVVDAGSIVNLNFGGGTEIIGSLFSSSGSQFVPIGTYTPAQLNSLYGFGANTFAGNGSLNVTAVPEPSTWALGAAAMLIFAIVARRRAARA